MQTSTTERPFKFGIYPISDGYTIEVEWLSGVRVTLEPQKTLEAATAAIRVFLPQRKCLKDGCDAASEENSNYCAPHRPMPRRTRP